MDDLNTQPQEKKQLNKPRAWMVVPLVFFTVIAGLLWFLYFSNVEHNRIYDNGTEVTATLTELETGSKTNDDGDLLYYYYYHRYTYTAGDGTVYSGSYAPIKTYRDKAEAATHTGDQIQIIIDGKGGSILAESGRADPESFLLPVTILTTIVVLGTIGIILYAVFPVLKGEFFDNLRKRMEEKELAKIESKNQKRNARHQKRVSSARYQKRLSKGKEPRTVGADVLILTFMLLITFGATVTLLTFAGLNTAKIGRFTPVEAKITGEELRSTSDSYYYAAVYEYYVDGVKYEYTDRVGEGSTSSSINGVVIKDEKGRPIIGRKVTLYINPANPSDVATVREANFFYIGGFIAFMCFYALITLAIIVPRLDNFRNAGGLFGSTVFIMMGMLLFLAPGLMNYAHTFKEFIKASSFITIAGLVFAAFGALGFIFELTAEVKNRMSSDFVNKKICDKDYDEKYNKFKL